MLERWKTMSYIPTLGTELHQPKLLQYNQNCDTTVSEFKKEENFQYIKKSNLEAILILAHLNCFFSVESFKGCSYSFTVLGGEEGALH